ncbi:MAG TPA: hypothetical protein VI893_07235 [Thermoplasmata archaeon]|nr:hypothetical protein [Thermoplasmata archaeon]
MSALNRPAGTTAGRAGPPTNARGARSRRLGPRRKGERATPAVIAGMLVFLLVLMGVAATAVYLDRTSPIARDQPNAPPGGGFGRRPLPAPTAAPTFLYPPMITDVDNTIFTISWVADQPINASVEFCESGVGGCSSGALAGTTTKYDILQYNMSHVGLVRVTGLGQATSYNYRAVAKNQSGGIGYHPSSAPYPTLTTKNHAPDTGNSNAPIFFLRPFVDVDGTNSYVDPPDKPALKFIGYINHSSHSGHPSPSVPMAVRAPCAPDGAGDCWVIPFSTSNMRNDDATGLPHAIGAGELADFFVAGVHYDGSSRYYFWNASTTLTNDGLGDPIQQYVPVHQGSPVFPQFSAALLVAASGLVAFAAVMGRSRTMKRTGYGANHFAASIVTSRRGTKGASFR